jgi:hypothetical protein
LKLFTFLAPFSGKKKSKAGHSHPDQPGMSGRIEQNRRPTHSLVLAFGSIFNSPAWREPLPPLRDVRNVGELAPRG